MWTYTQSSVGSYLSLMIKVAATSPSVSPQPDDLEDREGSDEAGSDNK